MTVFLQGAIMLASFAVSVFFLRYWRDTRDRLFGVFALAFALFGVTRIILVSLDDESEVRTWVYLLRALMFVAIIAAVVDKNLQPAAEPHDRADDADRHDPVAQD